MMMMSEHRCATKCYVLFIELATSDGADVILTERCKTEASDVFLFHRVLS